MAQMRHGDKTSLRFSSAGPAGLRPRAPPPRERSETQEADAKQRKAGRLGNIGDGFQRIHVLVS